MGNYRILNAAVLAKKVNLNYQRMHMAYPKSVAKIILHEVVL